MRILDAIWAALLSVLCPGLGHVYARDWWRSRVLLASALLLGLALTSIAHWAPPRPVWVGMLCAGVAIFMGLVVLSVVDAWRRALTRSTRPASSWSRSAVFVGVAAFAVMLALPRALPPGWRSFAAASTSMAPGLDLGDRFFVELGAAPSRGEVVVFAPTGGDASYAKRLVAVSGERVQMKAGVLHIEGTPVPQVAAGQVVIAGPGGEDLVKAMRETVGTRTYVVARSASGSAAVNDTPEIVVPAGHVFVIGDNRDNSLDSRTAGFGTVPSNRVVGVARTIYWSASRTKVLSAVN